MNYTTEDTKKASGDTGKDGHEEQEYTRFIVDALRQGTVPAFVKERAGVYGDTLQLLIDNYEADDIASFEPMLSAMKQRYPQFKSVLEEAPAPPNPDYTVDGDGTRSFKLLTISDVWQQPDIDWLVPGILQRATTSLVIGEGNVGKTFLWLDLCMHVAYGEKWLRRKTRQGTVLYIYAEGKGGLKQRMKAWMIEHGKATLQGVTEPTDQIMFIARPVHLLNDRQDLLNTIEKVIKVNGNAPEMVVIDTFSMCASGVEENSNSQVAQYLGTATDIKLKYGCHVTVVHHMNKSGGFRGASAFRDNVDTMITLDREDVDSAIKVECHKQRDGEYFPPFKIRLKIVELGINTYTNEPVTSCVVEEDTGEVVANNSKQKMPQKQVKMLELLEYHGSLTSSKWQKECVDAGISRDSFNWNVKQLTEQGKIQRTERIVNKKLNVDYSIAKVSDSNEDDDE